MENTYTLNLNNLNSNDPFDYSFAVELATTPNNSYSELLDIAGDYTSTNKAESAEIICEETAEIIFIIKNGEVIYHSPIFND